MLRPIINLLLLVSFSPLIFATTYNLTPQDDLQSVLNAAQNGDVIELAAGEYRGNFVVPHQVSVKGSRGAVLNAMGKGHGLELRNSNITVEDLSFINWGQNLTDQNSGIYTDKKAQNLILRNNRLEGDGFGIWVQNAKNVKIFDNEIIGNTALRSADRGNGIQLSIVQNVEVKGNTVSYVRDGLYIISSQQNVLKNNTMHHLRYGIHYMYSHSNKVLDNYAYNTRAGYALMSSRYLTVSGNKTVNSEDYGFLMNFITYSTISNNHIKDVWTKPENKVLGRDGKGLFVYNSAYNTISYNIIDTTEIGIHLTAGSEKTKLYGNTFVNNPLQVKYVSNKKQEWSQDGVGNYWSNYLGWDLNGDGRGDTPFEPNDGIDKIVWQYPEAKVLLDSPAVIILRWIQKQFPVLKPPGVKDSFPLMAPPLSSDQDHNPGLDNNAARKN